MTSKRKCRRSLLSWIPGFSNRNTSIRPIAGYPSSIVDSQGCEFGFEMYYHVPYAYHLYRQGLLEKTISCRDTACFYWFSPDHEERYDHRTCILEYPSIDQIAHQPPDLFRWLTPNFDGHYAAKAYFGFDRPIMLIFNKYTSEWDGPPVNYLSKELLLQIALKYRDRYQIVYFRPTNRIVLDDSQLFDLKEKVALEQYGVMMGETLHDFHPRLTFNELQLCLLAQSRVRISVQGGATYMNSLFPGTLLVLHRRGSEIAAKTYNYLKRLGVDVMRVHDNEPSLWENLQACTDKRPANADSTAA